ncbi:MULTISPECIES: MBL fold metallo-hydrolase [unclassified Actinopolyspora]|uniref:MBL fold metallo-hydrolase n=1 Tax=unclassified Actinopolyspora TaxID=2639451 RepID=UPI0013F63EDD|nr:MULTISPECIES: MBL fold metallo-hydrolase [unclassified Actinopolyspora]NHD16268.1 MBL fold metallo-hydrolase [Actinopolyspora sp. BKK2]NHE75869.1 MBL fold metallo-hydrolase [Actinopolyspora sp. BKK1]
MRLTHYGHSCVLVEMSTARLLIDPGTFSEGFDALRDLDAVLITHKHPDHLDTERLPAVLRNNPNARLVADTDSAAALSELGTTAEVARAGDAFELAGVPVEVVGGQHAVIHRDIPVIANIGYFFDGGAFYHPGDSFHVPEQRVDVLGLPTGAPWLKLSEAVDFLREVNPRITVPIHEAVLSVPEMHYGKFEQLGPEGTTLHRLNRGEPTEIPQPQQA